MIMMIMIVTPQPFNADREYIVLLHIYRYIDIIKSIGCKLQLHYNDILHNIDIILILGRYRTFRSQGGTQAPNKKIFE